MPGNVEVINAIETARRESAAALDWETFVTRSGGSEVAGSGLLDFSDTRLPLVAHLEGLFPNADPLMNRFVGVFIREYPFPVKMRRVAATVAFCHAGSVSQGGAGLAAAIEMNAARNATVFMSPKITFPTHCRLQDSALTLRNNNDD